MGLPISLTAKLLTGLVCCGVSICFSCRGDDFLSYCELCGDVRHVFYLMLNVSAPLGCIPTYIGVADERECRECEDDDDTVANYESARF